jgi:predicted DNA-binding transcriptional regulator AlpA
MTDNVVPMQRLLNMEQLAGYLGVTTKWLYEEGIPHDRLPVVRLGRAGRILRADPGEVREWLAAKRGAA